MKLLRFFEHFRILEAKIQTLEAERVKSDDEVRFWRSRAESAEIDRDKAHAEASYAMKAVANWQARLAGAPIVFNDLPGHVFEQTQATSTNWTPVEPHRRSMRDLQMEIVAKSRAAAADRRRAMKQDQADPTSDPH